MSLLSTLPLGLVPAVVLFKPPASTAMALSLLATGASLLPRMVMVNSAMSVAPAVSTTV
ncbi:hypothetical protein D3C78_992530 [compost metagenome]